MTPAPSSSLRPACCRRLARCLAAGLLALLPALTAQEPLERTHRSSLNQDFKAVPGAVVLVAAHETTVAQWQAFVQASGREWTYRPHFEQGPDHPVVGVTLHDARAFCSWLTEKEQQEGRLTAHQAYRLPTRMEWDAAVGLLRARKPDLTLDDKMADDRSFPWGQDWPPPAGTGNFAEGEIDGYQDDFPFTAPVGSFRPSPEGLFDLAGNVWEWCHDPEIRAEQFGVLRGGSWAYFHADSLRAGYLYSVPATLRMPTIGFRCVFEDRAQTGNLLAAMRAQAEKVRSERREALIGGEISDAERAEMRRRLEGATATSLQPDPAGLKPAQAGSRHINGLGMELLPLDATHLIAIAETRVQDYETFLKASGRAWPHKPPFLTAANHPATGVSWEDAVTFCEWLSRTERAAGRLPKGALYRLPSDQEWSRAAGLTETGADPAERAKNAPRHYPWSAEGQFPPPPFSVNLDASRMNGYNDRHSYTSPVLGEAANALGLHGLGGNAAEWVQDAWPDAPEERVIRGGSWLSHDPDQLLSSHRQHAAKDSATAGIGFRVLLELPPP